MRLKEKDSWVAIETIEEKREQGTGSLREETRGLGKEKRNQIKLPRLNSSFVIYYLIAHREDEKPTVGVTGIIVTGNEVRKH